MLQKFFVVTLVLSVVFGAWNMGMAASDPVKNFEQSLHKLVNQCEKSLKKATSIGEMDAMALHCDASVFSLLAALEQALGYPVEFERFDICVYNKKVDYEACFDPIIISGGS
jgi:hypothetical protein